MKDTPFNVREAVPVTLGSLTIYCEEFRVTDSTAWFEQPTVSGDTAITNCCRHAKKITLTGRVAEEDTPLGFIIAADSAAGTSNVYSFIYRGAVFSGCRVASFTAEDKGGPFFYVSVTLISSEPVTAAEVV